MMSDDDDDDDDNNYDSNRTHYYKWIETHPFLSGNDSNRIIMELNVIGKILLERYAHQVLERRQLITMTTTAVHCF